MKVILTLGLLILILINSCSSQIIPYQSHSFNDLDYIIQQLIKGVDAFKIDVNSVSRDSCEKYSTWKPKDNLCEIDRLHARICCLGFRGDTSSSPKLNDYFNTTNDLLTVLNNPKYDFIWHKEKRIPRYNRTISIAMNFQYDHIEGPLTKTWMSQMIQVIQQRSLDIKLILGGPRVIDHYGSLCKAKSQDCDNEAKIIASYPFILQASTLSVPKPPFGKIQNFNTIYLTLPDFCSQGFPSYADPLPYFFYEVAHEDDVRFIVNTYMSEKCKRRGSHPDLSSIRITSNIDPEMLQSYLPSSKALSDLKSAINVQVESLIMDQTILLSYFDTAQNITHIQIRSMTPTLELVAEVQLNESSSAKMSYKAPYLLLHSQDNAKIFLLDSTSPLSLRPLYTFSKPGITSDIFVYNSNCYFLQVEVQSQCPSDSLSFTLTDLQSGKSILTQCSDPMSIFKIPEIQNADIAVTLDSSTNTMRGILFISATYENFSQQKDALFAFTLSFNMDFQEHFSITVPKSYIDFGIDPSLKIIEYNNSLFVLEAHSNGICQCANLMNNGNMFKCGVSNAINPHYAHLQNVEYLMNYNWGKLNDFEERIQSERYINACDSQIMHAKFSNGEKPSGTVFRDPSTGTLQALFVNQHVDYYKLPFVTKLFCGATLMSDPEDSAYAVDVNTFNILDFYLFDYL